MPLSKVSEAKDFRKTIETIARTKSSPVSVFSDFVRMAACAVACQTREEEYMETIKKYDKDELHALCEAFTFLIHEMEQKPFSDLLGEYYQTIASKAARDGRGEFFTPEPVSELMARILIDVESVIEKGTPIAINEPTCGSGGIILQLAKQFSPIRTNLEQSHVDLLRVTAQDISPLSCNMTYLNTSVWGIPTQVLLGNTLTNEVTQGWNNIHWIRVGEHHRQRFRQLQTLMEQSSPEDMQEPSLDREATIHTGDFHIGEQMSFDL